jgi:hypothetical protein
METITWNKIGDELMNLWSVKNCKDISLHVSLNSVVTITATLKNDNALIESTETIVKKYRIEES